MIQEAPDPLELFQLVADCRYRPGWKVWLEDRVRDEIDGEPVGKGLTLIITTLGFDSYHPDRGESYSVYHFFIVPAATYNRTSWQRWLFDQFVKVETHEAMEFFQIEGARPFAPNHGPGEDPYIIHDPTTDESRRTSFRGVLKD